MDVNRFGLCGREKCLTRLVEGLFGESLPSQEESKRFAKIEPNLQAARPGYRLTTRLKCVVLHCDALSTTFEQLKFTYLFRASKTFS